LKTRLSIGRGSITDQFFNAGKQSCDDCIYINTGAKVVITIFTKFSAKIGVFLEKYFFFFIKRQYFETKMTNFLIRFVDENILSQHLSPVL
jgi:hypothetical protein